MADRIPRAAKMPITARRAPTPLDADLRQSFGPPPLHQGENADDYQNIYDRLRSAVAPRDVIEELWVRDVADLAWDTLRLRRVKAGLINAARSKGVARVLKDLGDPVEMAEESARKFARGDKGEKKVIDGLRKNGLIGFGVIEAQTLAARLNDFERIDRLIAQSEARRNTVLREIDRHRDAVARRMRDALDEIEDAEFEDIAPTQVEAAE